MKCRDHPQQDAIATCKTCGRGLCHECAATTEHGVYICSDRCRAEVTRDAFVRAAKVQEIITSAKMYRWGACLFFLLAVVCTLAAVGELVGYYLFRIGTIHPLGAIGFAAVLSLIAFVCFFGAARLSSMHRELHSAAERLD